MAIVQGGIDLDPSVVRVCLASSALSVSFLIPTSEVRMRLMFLYLPEPLP